MSPRRNDAMDEDSSSSESDFADFDDEVQPKKKPTFLEKDSDEEDLERLVLGNATGFRENLLKSYDGIDSREIQLAEADDDDAGLEDIQDSDLFMFDTGSSDPAAKKAKAAASAEKTSGGDAPVWEDSDDERLEVSLAGATRLRKLRISEAEDIVSGTEYTRRLRQQYLRLQPQPAWATAASEEPPTKRRRRSSAAASDDSDASSEDNDDDDGFQAKPLEKFLRSVNSLGGGSKANGQKKKQQRRLRPEVIDIQRTREIPDTHNAPVAQLSFHPSYPVLLSSSAASVLHLHHIAPEAHPVPNPSLTSVQVRHVNVKRAAFLHPSGDKIFFAGRRRYFHAWDLPSGIVQKTTQVAGHQMEHRTMENFRLSPCGRYMGVVGSRKKGGGLVSVLSTSTAQWLCAARMTSNHGIADFAWWSDGEGMTILGRDGQVGEYHIESRKFVGLWQDEGCVGGTVIALGGHQGPMELGEDRWVAVGSNAGIVNIYERRTLLSSSQTTIAEARANTAESTDEPTIVQRPKPTRTLEHIVNPITTLTFSPDGQLLAMATQHAKDTLKLVHLPSCTVYRNWPTAQTPLGRVRAVAFGNGDASGVLAVGDDRGKIRMWEIRA